MSVEEWRAREPRAPVVAMWICLALAWLFFVLPVPFTVILAVPLDIAAFILAILCLSRSRVLQGVLGLVGTTIVALVLYFIGWGVMAYLGAAGIKVEMEKSMAAAVAAVAETENPERIEAGQLALAYDSDPTEAEKRYHGKVLAVQGVVDDTSEEIFGVRGVAMGGNGDFKVYFVFPAERRNEAMSLARGDKVTIIGVSEFFIADGIVVMGATVAKDE